MGRLVDYEPSGDGANDEPPRHLDIRLGRGKRWFGFLAFVLLFVGVSALLVLLFVKFTASLRLAVGLVLFLVSYMLIMGWWASRHLEGRDR